MSAKAGEFKSGLDSWEDLGSWLKMLYAPSLPPLYNKTAEMQQRLSSLRRIGLIVKESCEIVERVQTEATAEYGALSDRLTAILQPVGLLPTDLPTTAMELSELSQIATTLSLPNMHIESFESAVAMQTILGHGRRETLDLLKDQIRRTERQVRGSQERQRRLRRLLSERVADAALEEQKTREWLRNARIVEGKVAEYRARLAEPSGEGVLEYKQMKELDGRVNELRREVEEKQRVCSGYSALPPDIQLAYVKLEEAKQTLDQLRVDCENAVAAAFATNSR
ncbi:hypothetical protein GGI25_004757 [Coemansia spiralis]|uniref:Uncharacterized protein n=2 Tax=Coemansia TaxID=4863 RepID=A0A9W8KWR1_9FUNG|nr:hypothetical protein BX070DRAFT_253682 [Coemansia spiralis]KAJ1986779.1 hypothetical protein EDC05_006169 [Coemansia umbellata]KAJ2618558.1 hypothetical protein GGI26_006506 [Coemansia sp. RSA 1358]KAJ2673238.1 hypothetical protein GGI25_004757 [Coemansia spiralis]